MLGRFKFIRTARFTQIATAAQNRNIDRFYVPTRYEWANLTEDEISRKSRRIDSMINKVSDDKRRQQQLLAIVDRPFMTSADYLLIDDMFRESSTIPDFISDNPNEGAWLATAATYEVMAIFVNELARQACAIDSSLTEEIAVKMLLDSAQHFESMSTAQRETLEKVCEQSARMSLHELRALVHELKVASHFRDQQQNPSHSHLKAAIPIFNKRSLPEIVQLLQHHSKHHHLAPMVVRQLAWVLYERAVSLYGVATTHQLCLETSHANEDKNLKLEQHDVESINRLRLGTLVQFVAQHDREARAAHSEAARQKEAVNEYSDRYFYE